MALSLMELYNTIFAGSVCMVCSHATGNHKRLDVDNDTSRFSCTLCPCVFDYPHKQKEHIKYIIVEGKHINLVYIPKQLSRACKEKGCMHAPSCTTICALAPQQSDPVTHPVHYTSHPSGIECIQITEHMNFCIGNAIKYLWRHDLKNNIEDLEKARWYINREIDRLSGSKEI